MGMLGTECSVGAALFCIYARARWSDFIHGNCIRVDVLESFRQSGLRGHGGANP